MSFRACGCGLPALLAAATVLSAQTAGPLHPRRLPPRAKPTVVSPPPARPVPAAGPDRPAPDRGRPALPAHADPLIAKAIAANVGFTEALPNFICKQITRRSESRTLGRKWKLADTVEADVIYEDGRESYQNVRVDGRPASSFDSLDGSTSTGEYGTILRNLFLDSTETEFRAEGASSVRGVATQVYAFSVRQESSHWRITVNGRAISPGYRGRLWLEPSQGRVYRIEMEAIDIPPYFPMYSSEIMVEYGRVEIAGDRYLLPVESANLFCSRSSTVCSKNELEFTDYRKFSASSSVFNTDSEIDFPEQEPQK